MKKLTLVAAFKALLRGYEGAIKALLRRHEGAIKALLRFY
jgi:hypothetical protein